MCLSNTHSTPAPMHSSLTTGTKGRRLDIHYLSCSKIITSILHALVQVPDAFFPIYHTVHLSTLVCNTILYNDFLCNVERL